MNTSIEEKQHANLDPITGAPGAHPVGVGIGAAAVGIVTGAAAGTLSAGPVGTVVGAAIGAVVGGLGGKAVAERIDPTVDGTYWQTKHAEQPYYADGQDYAAYEPAYLIGGQSRDKYANKSFDDVELSLAKDYAGVKGEGHVEWERAKHAARAAWDRVSSGA